jgi:membrane-bound lytic murein transglycosylase D
LKKAYLVLILFLATSCSSIDRGLAEAEYDVAAQVVPAIMPPEAAESRPWRAPLFKDQKQALGYTDQTFAVPKGMEQQVQFWVDVYGKYSTTQGVIHDSEDVGKIYEVVDLSGLKTDREKQKKIDSVKKVLAEKLSKEERERLRFQLGQKDRMQSAIYYSGRYLEEMETIFKESGLPIELTRLAFVESSFNIMARSKVGASGIWQIMPYTARPYKMISPVVDKRNHPIEATKLAAKLLRQHYNLLESWPLAITGYNHGPTGVLNMTKLHKTRELPELIRTEGEKKRLGFASRNFYASFLAALEVERNANKYFPNVVWAKPLNSQDLKLPVAVQYADIVKWFDGDHSLVNIFNPHLTHRARKGHPIPAQTVIAIPKEKYSSTLVALARKDRSFSLEEKRRPTNR